mgnify:FL=1
MFAETLLDTVVAGIATLPLRQFVEDVSNDVKNPVMDEKLHFPQLKTIASGDYTTWNDKISTPPGLYYLSLLYAKISNSEITLSNMRYFNFLGGVLLAMLVMLIRFKNKEAGFSAVSILLNPLIAIYYSLFYPDVWASVFIVAAYAVIVWKPKNSYILSAIMSAILGSLSVTFKQSNIVWVFFMGAVIIDSIVKDGKKYKYGEGIGDTLTFIKTGLANLTTLIPFIIVGVAFFTFVYQNGGVALGDKENQIIVPHLAQICYCVTFIMIFTIPIWISSRTFVDYVNDNLFSISGLMFNAAWIPILYIVIENFTIIHPSMLSDNRHYVFYFIRLLIVREEKARLQLIPVYHFSFYIIWKLFKNNYDNNTPNKRTAASPLIFYSFMICLSISVMLTPMFDLRYYIVPMIFFRLFVSTISEPVLPINILHTYNTEIRYTGEGIWLWMWTQFIYISFLKYTFKYGSEVVERVIW